MGFVSKSEGNINAKSENIRSEVAIICDMAEAILPEAIKAKAPWASFRADFDLIRDHIEAVIPGFDNYNQRIKEEKALSPQPTTG